MASIKSSQRFSIAAVLVCLACSCVHGKSLVPDEDSYSLARKPVRYDDLMLGDQSNQLASRNQQGQCDPRDDPRENDLAVTSPLRNGEAVETHALVSYEGAEEKGDRMLSFGGNVEQFKSDLDEPVELNCTSYVHGVLSEAEWNDTLTDLLVNMSIVKWNEAKRGFTDYLHFMDAETDGETGQLENREPKIYFVNKRWISSVLVKWTNPSEEVVGEYLCEFHLHNEADGESHPHKLTASIKPEKKPDVTTVAPTFAPTTKANCDHVDTDIVQLEQKKDGLEKLLELYRDGEIDMSYVDPETVSNRTYFMIHAEAASQGKAMTDCETKGGELANTNCDEIQKMGLKLKLQSNQFAWIGWKWLDQNGPKWVDFSGNTANTNSCQWATEGSEHENCSVYEFLPDQAKANDDKIPGKAYASQCKEVYRPLCVMNLWSN